MESDKLFQRKDYQDMYHKTFYLIKKEFENQLERNMQSSQYNDDKDSITSFSEDEEVNPQSDVLHLRYEGHEAEVPRSILELDTLRDVFNMEVIQKNFNQGELNHLLSFLPKTGHTGEDLKLLLSGAQFHFNNPVDSFTNKMKQGHFSTGYQRQLALEHKIYEYERDEYLLATMNHLKEAVPAKLKTLGQPENYQSFLQKRKLNTMKFDEEEISESEESFRSLDDVPVEHEIEGLTPDYTTIESNLEDAEHGEDMQMLNEMDRTLKENRKIEESLKRRTQSQGHKKEDGGAGEGDGKEGKQVKSQKNILTLKVPRTTEWIENYRDQERQRYNNPTKPWVYKLSDGSTAIVAPALKKMPTSNIKPRDHDLLKKDRPGFITLLCLVRDAAARLPNGVGTRADVCELLKDSQFINESVPEDRVSNIVSGALDRLHYENDACVLYDPEKKLWTYLHGERTPQYAAGDPQAIKKKDGNVLGLSSLQPPKKKKKKGKSGSVLEEEY